MICHRSDRQARKAYSVAKWDAAGRILALLKSQEPRQAISLKEVIRSAIVPVAGYGTRLLPATKSQPKEMLTVARKPIVQYVAEELVANGLSQILFVTSRTKSSIENHFDSDPELLRRCYENRTRQTSRRASV